MAGKSIEDPAAVNDRFPHSLTPTSAQQMLRDNPLAMLIDIRSTMEFLYVGHPIGAVHVPWIDEPDWQTNPDFVGEILRLVDSFGLGHDASRSIALILICRSGTRSREAAEVLLAAGLPRVFHVADGFEGGLDAQNHRGTLGGWRYQGLPWEQI